MDLHRSNIDFVLIALICIGIFFGLTLLYSADQLSYKLPLMQLLKGSVVIFFLIPIYFASDRNIRDISMPLYIISIILLLWVSCYGYVSNGAQRWLYIFLIRFEPSEIVKLTLPLALASIVHKNGIPLRFPTLCQGAVLILLPFILVLKQPDLGSSILLLMIGSITLFIAGLNRRLIIIVLTSFILLSPLLWHGLHDYQKQRILVLVSDKQDLQHQGYHIHQSKIAIGSGGLFGKGLGQGPQVQLGYIPEHKTDFIFALLNEELGFAGSLFWCFLVLTIGFRSVYLGYQQHQVFNKVTIVVLGFSFMLSAWVNMAMVCGIIPVVGIPLPFLSYGATSFVMTLVNFAIILKLGHTDPRRQYIW